MGLSRREVLILIASLPGGAALASASPLHPDSRPKIELHVPSKVTSGELHRLVVQIQNARRLQLFSNSDHHHTLIDVEFNRIGIDTQASLHYRFSKTQTLLARAELADGSETFVKADVEVV